jgi:hypothetical protein
MRLLKIAKVKKCVVRGLILLGGHTPPNPYYGGGLGTRTERENIKTKKSGDELRHLRF